MISIDIEQLRKRYLLANTADQLYKWFREDGSLPELAKGEYKEQLIEEYRRRTEKDERTIDDVVVAYAILAIVTFYEYREGKEIFRRLNLSDLKWGQEFESIYEQELRVTVYTTAHGRGIVDFQHSQSDDSNDTSYKSMSQSE